MSAGTRGEPAADLPHRSRYDLLGFVADVASTSAELIAALDRLNAEFRVSQSRAASAHYIAVPRSDTVPHHNGEHGTGGDSAALPAELWRLRCGHEELGLYESVLAAVTHLEWHICGQAIERRNDLLHVHGAAAASPRASILLPGTSGIGKTTFALALALRGLRLLSDDVVFLHADTWQPESFPRAFHIHDDALSRLAPLGLRYGPDDHIGLHLCSTVLGPWDRTPGPPLRYVVFPRLDPRGPLALEPISGAEATLKLMQYSQNLRSLPRFGLDLIPRLLAHAECYVLRRNDDLGAAADLVRTLLQGESAAGTAP